jgi:hypothetical protein
VSCDHLYRPAPCSSWPVDLLRVVGTNYREAAGQVIDQAERLRLTVAAYVTAGGDPRQRGPRGAGHAGFALHGARRLAQGVSAGDRGPAAGRDG